MGSELLVNFDYAGSVISGELSDMGYILYNNQKYNSIAEFIKAVTKDDDELLTNLYMDRISIIDPCCHVKEGILLSELYKYKSGLIKKDSDLKSIYFASKNNIPDVLDYIHAVYEPDYLNQCLDEIEIYKKIGNSLRILSEVFEGASFERGKVNIMHTFNDALELLSKI